jgi:hypothetical protein
VSFYLYISRLVKTRSPPFWSSYTSPFCLPHFLGCLFPLLIFSFHPSYLFPYLILLVHLLLVYLSGSAVTPSHLQRRPSVAIPSVRRPKLSHLWLHPHFIVQVGQTLSEALHTALTLPRGKLLFVKVLCRYHQLPEHIVKGLISFGLRYVKLLNYTLHNEVDNVIEAPSAV